MTNPELTKQRLDNMLVAQNLAPTRAKANDLIKAGFVSVDGKIVTKSSQRITPGSIIEIASDAPDYVSRGGVKLEHALTHFKLPVQDKTIIDLGSSTGGFTEVLLRGGAGHIYAVDIGHDQLHKTLCNHPRITRMEGIDARSLKSSDFTKPIDAITADLSFISLTKALSEPLKLVADGGWLIALIKPQFELSKKALGKGGIVRSDEQRLKAPQNVSEWLATQHGWNEVGIIPSPIEGQHGNKEFLLAATYKRT